MKKIIAILIFGVMLFSGCGANADKTFKKNSMNYYDESYMSTENGNEISISYPVFSDELLYLNKLISEIAFDTINQTSKDGEENIIINENYYMFFNNNKIISITFKGYFVPVKRNCNSST